MGTGTGLALGAVCGLATSVCAWLHGSRSREQSLQALQSQLAITQAHLEARLSATQEQLCATEQALQDEKCKRAADRAGRVRAEQQVRSLQLSLSTLQASNNEQNSIESSELARPPAQSANESALHNASIASSAVNGHTGTDHGPPTASASATNSTNHTSKAAIGAVHPQRTSLPVYPFKPIGYVQSCFSQRNGTPRQPHLVPSARAQVTLSPDIPDTCLEGLTHFSHCWILFVFHENTDLARVLSSASSHTVTATRPGVKAKITVPRLNGGRMGVLATRSPHRPCPIGLSVAKVLRVDGRRLLLGGLDIVDGSPVLDIKPYTPFCDAVREATAPHWVTEEASEEPLRVGAVHIPEPVRDKLRSCWSQGKSRSLYDKDADFVVLVEQVLSRDIRSLHQREHHPARQKTAQGATQVADASQQDSTAEMNRPSTQTPRAGLDAPEAQASTSQHNPGDTSMHEQGLGAPLQVSAGRADCPVYKVVLEQIEISYVLSSDTGAVEVVDARVWDRDSDGVEMTGQATQMSEAGATAEPVVTAEKTASEPVKPAAQQEDVKDQEAEAPVLEVADLLPQLRRRASEDAASGDDDDEVDFHDADEHEGTASAVEEQPGEEEEEEPEEEQTGSAVKKQWADDDDAQESEQKGETEEGDAEGPAPDAEASADTTKSKTSKPPPQPFDVPTGGAYWLHDDRFDEAEAQAATKAAKEAKEAKEQAKGKSGADSGRWLHDRFDQDDDGEPDTHWNSQGRRGGRGGRGPRGGGRAGRCGRGAGRGGERGADDAIPAATPDTSAPKPRQARRQPKLPEWAMDDEPAPAAASEPPRRQPQGRAPAGELSSSQGNRRDNRAGDRKDAPPRQQDNRQGGPGGRQGPSSSQQQSYGDREPRGDSRGVRGGRGGGRDGPAPGRGRGYDRNDNRDRDNGPYNNNNYSAGHSRSPHAMSRDAPGNRSPGPRYRNEPEPPAPPAGGRRYTQMSGRAGGSGPAQSGSPSGRHYESSSAAFGANNQKRLSATAPEYQPGDGQGQGRQQGRGPPQHKGLSAQATEYQPSNTPPPQPPPRAAPPAAPAAASSTPFVPNSGPPSKEEMAQFVSQFQAMMPYLQSFMQAQGGQQQAPAASASAPPAPAPAPAPAPVQYAAPAHAPPPPPPQQPAAPPVQAQPRAAQQQVQQAPPADMTQWMQQAMAQAMAQGQTPEQAYATVHNYLHQVHQAQQQAAQQQQQQQYVQGAAHMQQMQAQAHAAAPAQYYRR